MVKDDYLTSSQYDEGEETFLGMPFIWERELATSVERNRIEIEIKVFSENGDLLGKSVGEICESNPDFKFGIIAVLRDGKTIVPWSDFVFQNGNRTMTFLLKNDARLMKFHENAVV